MDKISLFFKWSRRCWKWTATRGIFSHSFTATVTIEWASRLLQSLCFWTEEEPGENQQTQQKDQGIKPENSWPSGCKASAPTTPALCGFGIFNLWIMRFNKKWMSLSRNRRCDMEGTSERPPTGTPLYSVAFMWWLTAAVADSAVRTPQRPVVFPVKPTFHCPRDRSVCLDGGSVLPCWSWWWRKTEELQPVLTFDLY